ncbi:IDEAL domain-containing protein [Neobacillus sp. Marseille-QA0830]
MRKLKCRYCGNDEFFVIDVGVNWCKCGLLLTQPIDYARELPPKRNKHISMEQRCQAEIITKMSLLQREIDQCLDERNQEKFQRLTYELKVCRHYLGLKAADPQGQLHEKLL